MTRADYGHVDDYRLGRDHADPVTRAGVERTTAWIAHVGPVTSRVDHTLAARVDHARRGLAPSELRAILDHGPRGTSPTNGAPI